MMNKVQMTARDIADILNGELIGPEDLVISHAQGLEQADEQAVSFIKEAEQAEICFSQAGLLIVPMDTPEMARPMVKVKEPRLSFVRILRLFAPREAPEPMRHSSAVISASAEIAESASIQAQAVIESGVKIGERVFIGAGVYIGKNVTIEDDTTIHPGVVICEHVQLGKRVVVHPNVSIGAQGYGFVQDGKEHMHIPHLGNVVIEDDVELFPGVTVARGGFGTTRIGRGTKINAQSLIAHNVDIGTNCLIVGQVGIAGSTKLGDDVIIAGKTAILDHLDVGDGAIVLTGSVVSKNIPARTTALGNPAIPHQKQKQLYRSTRKLPELLEEFQKLQQRIAELEKTMC